MDASEVHAHADDILDHIETLSSRMAGIRNSSVPIRRTLESRRIDEYSLEEAASDVEALAEELRDLAEDTLDVTRDVLRALDEDLDHHGDHRQ